MRIAINASFWGRRTTGTGQYLHHLVSEMHTLAPGLELELLAPTKLVTDNAGPVTLLNTPVDGLGENVAKLWFEQVTFPFRCADLNCDLAHVPYMAPPLMSSVPVVVTVHDLIPLIFPPYSGSLRVRAYTRLVATAARQAEVVITDSQTSAQDIARLLGITGERLRVIPLAAEPSYRPISAHEAQPVLARHGLDRPYVLYLGGFDMRKNVSLLIEAFGAIASQTSVILAIAGRLPESDSAFAPDPRPIAARLHLGERVRFLGEVTEADKPALYSGALAFAYPSLYEGFGLPVLEAISCGTPVVVGAGSSLEEVAGPGGLAVPPYRADELRSALWRLIHEPSLRQELSAGGLEHARHYSWRQVASQTLDAYTLALRGRR